MNYDLDSGASSIPSSDFDENSKDIIITIVFYQGSDRKLQREITLDVSDLSNAEIAARAKTALDWAEKGFYA